MRRSALHGDDLADVPVVGAALATASRGRCAMSGDEWHDEPPRSTREGSLASRLPSVPAREPGPPAFDYLTATRTTQRPFVLMFTPIVRSRPGVRRYAPALVRVRLYFSNTPE